MGRIENEFLNNRVTRRAFITGLVLANAAAYDLYSQTRAQLESLRAEEERRNRIVNAYGLKEIKGEWGNSLLDMLDNDLPLLSPYYLPDETGKPLSLLRLPKPELPQANVLLLPDRRLICLGDDEYTPQDPVYSLFNLASRVVFSATSQLPSQEMLINLRQERQRQLDARV